MHTPQLEPYGIHPDATAQEVFDKAARHLFAQGEQSVSESGLDCLYRGPGNTACAAGCLVADEDYTPEMEHKSVHDLAQAARKGNAYGDCPSLRFIGRGAIGRHCDLLTGLQDSHDLEESWRTSGTMRIRLRNVAREHGLDAAILDTLAFADR